ncbi:MAG: dihydrofolate reductase [Alphaproteobacteria bacterium]|nr:dihydrofolate reductase [Alphaproteobacteria bacterium]
MATLVFGMNVSLDGFVDHDAFAPGPALFQHFIAQTRGLAGSIYGRGLYTLMRYWDSDEWDQHDPETTPALRDFAEAWRRQPKWVVSRSLKEVGPNAALLGDDFEAEIRSLKADLDGRIDVGGPKLAASLMKLGLVDEIHMLLRPGVLGRGAPFFAGVQPKLRLIGSERIGEDAVRVRYGVD